MKYKILSSSSITGIEMIVNEYIKLGWKPLGGLDSDKTHYFQAMTKD